MNARGGLQDFSIRHAPSTSAFPEANEPRDAAFALLRAGSTGDTRLVEGPFPEGQIYGCGLRGQGLIGGGFEGLPRFSSGTFLGEYPFGTASLSDPDFPLAVEIRGWNPFVPLDAEASGIPCAILDYSIRNTGLATEHYAFSYHLSHLAHKLGETDAVSEVLPGSGVLFGNKDPELGSAAFGLLSCTGCDAGMATIKGHWFRGGWFDAISRLWDEVSTGALVPNEGVAFGDFSMRIGGSAEIRATLGPGQVARHTVVLCWHFPVLPPLGGIHGQPFGTFGFGSSVPRGKVATTSDGIPARPWYATRWEDARAILQYVFSNHESLERQTETFHKALFASTLPEEVIDAVSANLAILKSPTILREAGGGIWAWEGCFSEAGCCSGSCTHVWNYAQAMAHLFPALERSLRELELLRSMDGTGHVQFRSPYEGKEASHTGHAAIDGQLGGIMKLHREWLICADRPWLERMYPLARTSIEYCIRTWDPRGRGLPEEPHHNTYDIEFWGPDPLSASFYVGALAAMEAMAKILGKDEEAIRWSSLAGQAAARLKAELWNGEYYEQKVAWQGLGHGQFDKELAGLAGDGTEEAELLKQEGPKYQFGRGCLSDGVFGAWLAELCGVESPQDRAMVQAHLDAVYRHNFRPSLKSHPSTQRPGYALGDEAGLLLCSWPQGGRPALPFVYADEVWSGVEYQVASHLIRSGRVAEGLQLVRATRARYDGRKRNPVSEYECGSWYARAMASYALLYACTGFAYSAPDHRLVLEPRLPVGDGEGAMLCSFFSVASGWGSFRLGSSRLSIKIEEGFLDMAEVIITMDGKTTQLGILPDAGGMRVKAGTQLVLDLMTGEFHVA
jgi:uncharacterized protein (DUF608 family)